jgi:hypothetical protein
LEADSNSSHASDIQSEKQNLQSTSTDAGIIIAVKPLFANADSSIRLNFEADSIVIDAMDVQSEKENLQSTPTNAGTKKAIKPLFANADSLTRRICEPVSKITNASDLQLKKYAWDSLEIDDEIHDRPKHGGIMESRVNSFMIPSPTILLRVYVGRIV